MGLPGSIWWGRKCRDLVRHGCMLVCQGKHRATPWANFLGHESCIFLAWGSDPACLTPNSHSFHTLPFHKCTARTHVKTPIFLFYTIYCSKQSSWQSFPGDGDGCHAIFWMPAHPSVPILARQKSVRCLLRILGCLHMKVNLQVFPQLRVSLACI